jgi:hypothetical protein
VCIRGLQLARAKQVRLDYILRKRADPCCRPNSRSFTRSQAGRIAADQFRFADGEVIANVVPNYPGTEMITKSLSKVMFWIPISFACRGITST